MRNVGKDRRSFNSPFNIKRVQQPEGISFEFWMQIWAVRTRGACPTRRFFGCCQEGKRKKKRRLTATLLPQTLSRYTRLATPPVAASSGYIVNYQLYFKPLFVWKQQFVWNNRRCISWEELSCSCLLACLLPCQILDLACLWKYGNPTTPSWVLRKLHIYVFSTDESKFPVLLNYKHKQWVFW